jgi:hypothetical protein
VLFKREICLKQIRDSGRPTPADFAVLQILDADLQQIRPGGGFANFCSRDLRRLQTNCRTLAAGRETRLPGAVPVS